MRFLPSAPWEHVAYGRWRVSYAKRKKSRHSLPFLSFPLDSYVFSLSYHTHTHGDAGDLFRKGNFCFCFFLPYAPLPPSLPPRIDATRDRAAHVHQSYHVRPHCRHRQNNATRGNFGTTNRWFKYLKKYAFCSLLFDVISKNLCMLNYNIYNILAQPP